MFNSLGRAHVENTIGGRRGHVLRRITHLSMIILPFIYYWHGNQIAELVTEIIEIETSREGVVLIALSLLVIIEAIRLFFGIAILGQRTYEKRQISALAWGGNTVCLCLLFAPLGGYKEAYIGLPIIFTISIVDPLLGETRRIFESDKLVILIAFIVGLFAPASKGYQIGGFNQTFSLFFAAASAIAALVYGRILGRLIDFLWWLPFWMSVSMGLYLGAVKMIGG